LLNENSAGANYWYNFTAESAGGSLRLASLTFLVQTPNGSNVTPGSGWSFEVFNLSGSRIGSYAISGQSAGTWTVGGSQPMLSGQHFSLLATPDRLSGDSLLVRVAGTGQCPTSGSVSIAIP
jgi:hypothetical protein